MERVKFYRKFSARNVHDRHVLPSISEMAAIESNERFHDGFFLPKSYDFAIPVSNGKENISIYSVQTDLPLPVNVYRIAINALSFPYCFQ
jgi:hypothetical protein